MLHLLRVGVDGEITLGHVVELLPEDDRPRLLVHLEQGLEGDVQSARVLIGLHGKVEDSVVAGAVHPATDAGVALRPHGVSRARVLRAVDVAEQPIHAAEGGEERLPLEVVGTLEAEGDQNVLLHVDGCIGSEEGRGDAVSHGAGCGRPEDAGGSRGLRRFCHDGLARLITRSRGAGRRRRDEVRRPREAAAGAVRRSRAAGLAAAWAARRSQAAGTAANGRRTGAAEGASVRRQLCGAMARALESGRTSRGSEDRD